MALLDQSALNERAHPRVVLDEQDSHGPIVHHPAAKPAAAFRRSSAAACFNGAKGGRMRLRLVVIAGMISLAAGFIAAQGMYAQVGDIVIGGPLPAQWDYLLADSAGKRLYVSHGQAEVVVIDTSTNKVIGRIEDTPGIHGMAVGAGKVFTSNGREGKVSIVDPKTLATSSKVDTGGANPDAIVFEPVKKEVWAFNHTGKSAAEIDATTGKLIATIPLSGTAETGQPDATGSRIFVNIEDKDGIDVIDVASKKVVATWSVAPGAEPTGMAVDHATKRLFVGAGKMMVMMDYTNGKVVANVPICVGTDATWYDAGAKLAFSSCRDGRITVAKVDGDKMTVVQTIETSPGSKTMALDAASHKLYVAAAKPAASGRGNDPASFHVIVYGVK
jgi:DNA-binding beta-propeller fold protein YncE